MKLYKYCKNDGINILRDKRLKITEISTLNDPFEHKLSFDVNFTYKSILDDINTDEEAKNKLMDACLEAKIYRYDIAGNFLDWYVQNGKKYFKFIKFVCVEAMRTAVTETYNYLNQEFRIICLSACPDNILMWSHYGENHTGILVKFESDNFGFKNTGEDVSTKESIIEVEYREERVVLTPTMSFNNNKHYQVMKDLSRIKYTDWKYEKEYRILFRYDRTENKPYVDINSKSIEEVVFGLNCDSSTETSVKELAKIPEYGHIILKKAKIHHDRFSLIYETL
jgi:hypothetical protein